MLILAVETSGRTGSVAIVKDKVCTAESTLTTAGRRHAQTLVVEAKNILQQHYHKLKDCDAVAVSIGPGSFTGLRVGIVFAKTMAFATGCKLIAVDTLQCIADRTPKVHPNVHVISDAQRGDVFVNRFGLNDAGFRTSDTRTQVVNAEAWFQSVDPTEAVSGPGLVRFKQLTSKHPTLVDEQFRTPSAESLGTIAVSHFVDENFVDPYELEPFYLRKSAAEEKWDAAHPVE